MSKQRHLSGYLCRETTDLLKIGTTQTTRRWKAMEAVRFKSGMSRGVVQSRSGNHPTPHPVTVSYPDNQDPVINIQYQIPRKPVTLEGSSMPKKGFDTSDASCISMQSEDDNSMVFDMGATTHPSIENLVSSVRFSGTSKEDYNIKWRRPVTVISDSTDIQCADLFPDITQKQRGSIINGNDTDVYNLLKEEPSLVDKGVICNSQVLCCDSGDYAEGKQYTVYPDSKLSGAFGEVVLCQDFKSGRTVMRKMVPGRVMKNEVIVPLMFRDCPGIPEVFGIIQRPETTAIFQEFAGLSLDKLCNSHYAMRLREPGILLGLAFQGFRTLEKLHSKGIQHLDIKPQNICVDLTQKAPCLKFIDFGSCQMPGEVTTEGVTYEYLSPESCRTLIQMVKKQLARAQLGEGSCVQADGRLEAGADVWAFTLSLIYCLCGYHLMVFACTGIVAYPEDTPEQIKERRTDCLFKICKMTDDNMASLMSPMWADVLKVLFINTLRVNPSDRWTAGQSAAFILKCISTSAQKESQPSAPTSRCGTDSLGVRLRVHAAKPLAENPLSPWTSQASPAGQVAQYGDPVPHTLSGATHAQPGKRKWAGGTPTQGYKVIRK